MQKRLIYSEKKFKSFNLEKQLRILLEILKAIELSRNDCTRFLELKQSYTSCLAYIDSSFEFSGMYEELSKCLDDKRLFSLNLADLRNKLNDRFKENELQIYTRDKQTSETQPLPIVVVLDNLRSSFNVGSIFRTTECVNASKIYCCGITPTPEMSDVVETSMGTAKLVEWEYIAETSFAIEKLRQDGYAIVAMETAEPSINLYEYDLKTPLAIVMGNEALGLSPEILQMCDNILRIPVRGRKNSLNVAVSYAVTAYEILRKYGDKKS